MSVEDNSAELERIYDHLLDVEAAEICASISAALSGQDRPSEKLERVLELIDGLVDEREEEDERDEEDDVTPVVSRPSIDSNVKG
jgi:hypothetical protein